MKAHMTSETEAKLPADICARFKAIARFLEAVAAAGNTGPLPANWDLNWSHIEDPVKARLPDGGWEFIPGPERRLELTVAIREQTGAPPPSDPSDMLTARTRELIEEQP